jgi:hypothetical protein
VSVYVYVGKREYLSYVKKSVTYQRICSISITYHKDLACNLKASADGYSAMKSLEMHVYDA